MSKGGRNKRGGDGDVEIESADHESTQGMQDITKLLALMVDSQRQAEQRRLDEEKQRDERTRLEEERRIAEEQKRLAEEERHRQLEREALERQRADDNKRWETLFSQQQEQFRMFREHAEKETEQREKEFEEKALRSLRMPKLKEADDIESFLLAFERQMLTQGPPKRKWVTHLVPLLSGKALKAYTGLSDVAAKEYDTVKETILKYFNIGITTYRNRFKAAKMKENESAQEFSTRLTDLFMKWSSSCANIDELRQLILVDKFVSDLPSHIRSWLWDKKPETLAAAAELHDDYVASRREEAPFNKSSHRYGSRRSHDSYSDDRGKTDRRDNTHEKSATEKSDRVKTDADKQPNPRLQPKFDPEKGPRCFNCNQYGHMASRCPGKASVIGAVQEIIYQGTIQGKQALRMRPDSGADRTIVHRRMVPTATLKGRKGFFKSFSGQDSHLDLADVVIEIARRQYTLEVAVMDNLQYDALLGMDIPELFQPLQQKAAETVMSVRTRAQLKRAAAQQQETVRREKEDAATLTPLPPADPPANPSSPVSSDTEMDLLEEEISQDTGEMDLPPFSDDLFLQVQPRKPVSKSQKRETAQNYSSIANHTHSLDGGAEKLSNLQRSDPTLETARSAADEKSSGYLWEDGLLYRMWTPKKDDEAIQQLVLPQQYRHTVLKTAHSIPMAGHLGRKKTISRVTQRFYWPGLRDQVAEMCKGCIECQKTARVRKHRAPMIPLPVMDQPFQRIAMDMVGPLPRSKAGHKYILTICDYGSRYPEAIPLKLSMWQRHSYLFSRMLASQRRYSQTVVLTSHQN